MNREKSAFILLILINSTRNIIFLASLETKYKVSA